MDGQTISGVDIVSRTLHVNSEINETNGKAEETISEEPRPVDETKGRYIDTKA